MGSTLQLASTTLIALHTNVILIYHVLITIQIMISYDFACVALPKCYAYSQIYSPRIKPDQLENPLA